MRTTIVDVRYFFHHKLLPINERMLAIVDEHTRGSAIT